MIRTKRMSLIALVIGAVFLFQSVNIRDTASAAATIQAKPLLQLNLADIVSSSAQGLQAAQQMLTDSEAGISIEAARTFTVTDKENGGAYVVYVVDGTTIDVTTPDGLVITVDMSDPVAGSAEILQILPQADASVWLLCFLAFIVAWYLVWWVIGLAMLGAIIAYCF